LTLKLKNFSPALALRLRLSLSNSLSLSGSGFSLRLFLSNSLSLTQALWHWSPPLKLRHYGSGLTVDVENAVTRFHTLWIHYRRLNARTNSSYESTANRSSLLTTPISIVHSAWAQRAHNLLNEC
jgi:hypothetical protein